MKEQFQTPQRQSPIGILLIFTRAAYLFFKKFWALVIFVVISSPEKSTLYGRLGLVALLVLGMVYSYVYYRNYHFHIDFENRRFVLQKGVFRTELLKIPFDKIQQVDLKQSLLQKFVGVYGLSIDTAGSKSDEVHIRALSEEKATALSNLLTTAQKEFKETEPQEGIEINEEKSVTSTKIWEYHLPLITLLKIGFTKSFLRGFLLVFGFGMSLYTQLEDLLGSLIDEARETSRFYWSEVSGSLLLTVVIAVLVILISMAVTVLEVVFRHFDLNIFQTKERMEVKMGLLTNTKVSFQARRLQLLRILTNPIQKRLNLYEVQFSLASSQDELQKGKIRVPGLNPSLIQNIKDFLYDRETGIRQNFKPHRAWVNRRYILTSLPLIPLGLFIYLEGPENPIIPISLGFLYILILFPYQYFVYKSIKIQLSTDFLVIEQGLWTQVQQIVEIYKLEGVSVRQPFWYKRRNLHNLVFHTAGGDMSIRAVPFDFVKQINYMLYKVETSDRPWM